MKKLDKPHTELIVALDFPDVTTAGKLVSELRGLPVTYKVGFELFVSSGPEFVRRLIGGGSKVFLDLKFYDIPNTVAKAAQAIAQLNVDMFTVHLSGGKKMIATTAETLAVGAAQKGTKRPKILGVSVLTSFDDPAWGEVTHALTGTDVAVSWSVSGLVSEATGWGVDGIVCSAQELSVVKRIAPKLYTVVPGIRPKGSPAGDQARVMTPEEAHEIGADAVVIGRPITAASNPKEVTEAVLESLGHTS
ncbi:orotidine-5'-phosphate decarboxylase [bacterium]|nr:orotidine-5'-phosphate decarboxylase [bacterium]